MNDDVGLLCQELAATAVRARRAEGAAAMLAKRVEELETELKTLKGDDASPSSPAVPTDERPASN